MWLEMKVKGLALEPLSKVPVIILRNKEEKRSLPISGKTGGLDSRCRSARRAFSSFSSPW